MRRSVLKTNLIISLIHFIIFIIYTSLPDRNVTLTIVPHKLQLQFSHFSVTLSRKRSA